MRSRRFRPDSGPTDTVMIMLLRQPKGNSKFRITDPDTRWVEPAEDVREIHRGFDNGQVQLDALAGNDDKRFSYGTGIALWSGPLCAIREVESELEKAEQHVREASSGTPSSANLCGSMRNAACRRMRLTEAQGHSGQPLPQFVQRRFICPPLIAMATAFFCPASTTRRLPQQRRCKRGFMPASCNTGSPPKW